VLIYLDTNIVIYLIEQPPGWGARATTRVTAIRTQGDRMAVSDLVRLECRVKPIRTGDAPTLGDYDTFFTSADVQVLTLTTAVCDRATHIRARYRYKLADALNLAAAVEGSCDVFLTNDLRLSGFPDITVEVLP
jgi:predicted nucleic acid-binding protein